MKTIIIGDDEYNVEEAKTKEEKSKGLSNRKTLADDAGMLFYFENPQKVSFWMKDTLIPLDIIFIDANEEIISIKQGIPEDETPIIEDNVKYVLEVNANSGISIDDDVNLNPEDDSKYVMKVLAQDGSTQFQLQGGERICSRKETIVMIRKAKKAARLNSDGSYKSLGKYLFKVFTGQDNRDPEYVELKD